jgi:hypothetical protein
LYERRIEAVSERRTSMTEVSLEQNMTAARHEHLVPGREIHMQDMRGYRFCEVGLISGTSQDNAIVNIWNTTGACSPTPEQFDALDADAIARENEAQRAWLNPVRRWMFDRLDVREAGDDRTFGDITGTWMGVAGEATMMQAAVQGSYNPGYMYRSDTFTFSRGSEVYLLPAGQPAQRLPGLGCRQGIQPAMPRRLAVVGPRGANMSTRHTPPGGLGSVGFLVMRCGLATTFLWVGALKFKDYEVQNAEVLVTASPLTSRLREKLGAQKFGRLDRGADPGRRRALSRPERALA